MSQTAQRRGVLFLSAAVALGAVTAHAANLETGIEQPSRQTADGKNVRRGRTVKQPLIDLAKQAQQRRSGQVLPGDPPPEKFAAPIAPPAAPPAAAAPVIDLAPEVTPPPPPPVKPAVAPVNPESGPRPLPAGGSEPEPSKSPSSAMPVLRSPGVDESAPFENRYRESAASVQVVSIDGPAEGVQWRREELASDSWSSCQVGASVRGLVEIRTSMDTSAVFTTETVELVVTPLSKVTVSEAAPTSTASSGVMACVSVERGTVEVADRGGSDDRVVVVRTPDRGGGFEVSPGTAGVRIVTDAFRGARVEATDRSAR